jgi:hypothetical protein
MLGSVWTNRLSNALPTFVPERSINFLLFALAKFPCFPRLYFSDWMLSGLILSATEKMRVTVRMSQNANISHDILTTQSRRREEATVVIVPYEVKV